jgi:hypothetical protein
MEIVVGSKNIPKQLAVNIAFRKMFPGQFLEIKTVDVDSG